MVRCLMVFGVLFACTKQPQPQPQPNAHAQPDERLQTSPPSTPDAAVADVRPDAAASAPPPPVIEIAGGIGECSKDDDCELSNWQPGCQCVERCLSIAISKRELAARIKKENCPKVRTTPCPPAAPCPQPKYRVRDAVCADGKCASRRELLPPARPDPGI